MTTPTTVSVRLQLRADTAANWTSANPTLLANELGRETDTGKIKIGDGSTAWSSLAYQAWATLPIAVASGGTGQTSYTNGQLLIGNTTGNTLTKATLTAGSGIAITNGTGSITVAASGISDAQIAADAEIAVSKLADGAARQLLQTDAAGTGVEWASNIDIPGTLDVTSAATFDSTIGASAGTASLPSITFTGDLNTGIYSPGADQVAISTNGTNRFQIDSSGNITVDTNTFYVDAANNRVGVGTTALGSRLDVSEASPTNGVLARFINTTSAGGTNAGISLVNSDPVCSVDLIADRVAANFGSDFVIRLADGIDGTKRERLRITETGLVGIGTSNPGSVFHARLPNTSTATIATFDRSDGAVASEIHYDGSDGRITFGTTTNHPLSFETNNTRAVTIDTSQRVGIGTTAPQGILNVTKSGASTTPNLVLASGGAGDPSSVDPSIQFSASGAESLGTTKILSTGAYNARALAFHTGTDAAGTERARIDSSGRLLVGTSTSRSNWYNSTGLDNNLQIEGTTHGGSGISLVRNQSSTPAHIEFGASGGTTLGSYALVASGAGLGAISFQGADGTEFVSAAAINAEVDGTPGANDMPGRLVFSTTADGASSPTERMRITNVGSSDGNLVMYVGGNDYQATDGRHGLAVYKTQNNGTANAANSVVKVGIMQTTARSINAAGTVNASGADYAEYMVKDGNFTIAKGDICGVTADGFLTLYYADAVSFVVKSTNPSYVGGDTWGNADVIGERPEDDADALAQWEADLEAARQTVDRIAFAGQVPVNVTGATPGQYIVPVEAAGGGIKGIAKDEADLTLAEYMRAVGKVIAIEDDGRARIIVKVA